MTNNSTIFRASKEAEDLGHLIEKSDDDIEQLKVLVKNEKKTILDLKKQILIRDNMIEQKEAQIFVEKLKMKDLEKQLLLAKENTNELEQTVQPLMMEIQVNKKVIEDVCIIAFNNNYVGNTKLYNNK